MLVWHYVPGSTLSTPSVRASQQLASVGQGITEGALDAGAFAPPPRLSVLAEAAAEVAINTAALHTQNLCAARCT